MLRKELLNFNKIVAQKAGEVVGSRPKVVSWLNSVSSFLVTCYTRYWHYRDLIAPVVVSTGDGRAGQGRAGQGRAGQGRAGQGRAGLAHTREPARLITRIKRTLTSLF